MTACAICRKACSKCPSLEIMEPRHPALGPQFQNLNPDPQPLTFLIPLPRLQHHFSSCGLDLRAGTASGLQAQDFLRLGFSDFAGVGVGFWVGLALGVHISCLHDIWHFVGTSSGPYDKSCIELWTLGDSNKRPTQRVLST